MLKPSDICDICWRTVIANHLGLLSSPILHVNEDILSPVTGGFAYTISGKDLKAGTNQKCLWCTLVSEWSSVDFKSEEEVEVRVGKNGIPGGEHVVDIYVNNDYCWLGYVYTKEGDPAATHIPGRNLYVDIGTKHALLLAETLLNDCIQNHKDCVSPPDPPPVLPTRLVDCSDPDRPRLHISTNNERSHYAILSYVWGEDITNKLTKDNLESYKLEIPDTKKFKTIRDAILTTHRLGLQYIWIDSLCLIQIGDNDDKGRELQRMSSYYKDSYVAIIAASSEMVSAGFLETRKDTFGATSIAFPFIMPDKGSVHGTAYLYPWTGDRSKYEPDQEPIHTRGWCMQEYFLSPRSLIFASPTLQYHCHRGTHNIAGAENSHWISSEREPVPISDLPKSPVTNEDKQKIQQAWKSTIENYTKRNVSHSEDKLLALASLAQEFFETVQTPYLAGLWERTLLYDLLWSKENGKHYPSRPEVYRAPSWSWASLDGEVNAGNAFFDDKQEIVAEVKRCDTTPKDPKLPFGEVKNASLLLRAKVLSDCVMEPHWAIYHLGSDSPGHKGQWIDEASGKRMEEVGMGKLDCDNDQIGDGHPVWIVVIACRDDILDTGTRAVQGILVELNSQSPTSYRCVGFFERKGDTRTVDGWLDSILTVDIKIV